MRVLSDFDGVLTNIAHEAARVTEYFLDKMWEAAPTDEGPLPEVLGTAYAEMEACPEQHGWRVKGRITAFANEDGFIRINGLAAHLDAQAALGNVDVRTVLAGLMKLGLPSFSALAQTSYEQMTRETAAGKIRPLDPEASAVLKALIARGDEIVVVSNSGTDRICQLLRGAGLEPAQDSKPGGGPLRVRGNARKFLLGDTPRSFEVGGYRVATDRPFYEQILLEERPDVIIGDVFSLDLALPLDLVRRGVSGFGRPRLVLRLRSYTPAWSANYVIQNARGDAHCDVIDRLELLA
jgi:FMN phosphatase YigB (HAD superfamily)